MSQQRIARLIAARQATMARQDNPGTRATICEVLRNLAALAITEGQAIRILAATGARIDDPARRSTGRRLPNAADAGRRTLIWKTDASGTRRSLAGSAD